MGAARIFTQNRGLAAVAIGSLALGIGGNVTVYSVVREMMLDDLSAARPERLVRTGSDLSFNQYRQLQQAGVFEGTAFYRSFSMRNWRAGNHSEIVWTIEASPNFFDLLGVRAGAGRVFTPADTDRVAVASYAFWKRRMGGDPSAIGRPMELHGQLYSLVGVLPEDYRSVYGMSISPEVYVQAAIARPEDHAGIVFGRLRDGQSIGAARQTVNAVAERLWGADFGRRFSVLRPMAGFAAHAVVEGNGFYLFFLALFAVAGIMALIACANVAGLLIARGLSRQRELAIRKALGASRWQMARPLVGEAALLVAAGAAAGLLLHWFLAAQLSAVRFPSAYGVPFEFHFRTDGGVLLYAVAVSLAALAVSALLPAMRTPDVDLALALKHGEPAFSMRRWNLRSGFVALQMALAVMLLALGALFTRSFVHVSTGALGFDAGHILMTGIQSMPGSGKDLRERLVRRIETVPGVVAVTSTWVRPLAGELPKAPVSRAGEAGPERSAYVSGVGERYCETMGIPILRGRDFQQGDAELRPKPAIVNRTLAKQLFGGSDPLGQPLRWGRDKPELLQVVGVAADSKMRTLGEEDVAALYLPDPSLGLMVRVAGDPARWIAPVRQAIAEIDPRAGLDVRPIADAVAGGVFPMRIAAVFVGSLSAVGLLLALVGLYAAVAHAVTRRTREMGIRMALGATRANIVRVAIVDGMAVLTIGGLVGLALAIALIRPLVGIVPDGVNPWAAAQFAGVVLLLLAAGAAATLAPARRAARVDPAVALREE